MVPDGDLFKALSAGDASVVTDRIAGFTDTGIQLRSGQHLDADIVVTATGLTMLAFGGIQLSIDGRPINSAETTAYKAMMLDGVPNFVFAFGPTNISWTLKVDLVCAHFCRLLDHMDTFEYSTVTPVLDDPDMDRVPLFDLTSGYVQRGIGQFPKAGTRGPWASTMADEDDVARLRDADIVDPALHFGNARSTESKTTSRRQHARRT